MSPNKDKILDIYIPGTSKAKVLKQVQYLVSNAADKPKNLPPVLIVTPNPEIILLTYKDNKYRSIIANSELKIPDGIGLAVARKLIEVNFNNRLLTKLTRLVYLPVLYLAALFTRGWLTNNFEIIHGRKIFLDIISLANAEKWKIYLFGSRETAVQKSIFKLTKNYKDLKVQGRFAPEYDTLGNPKTPNDEKLDNSIVRKINSYQPDILFVGLQPPKQEYWFAKNKDKLNAKIIMCVGGTFDYISGTKKLPPKWIEKMELEWFWRLITDRSRPNHIKRLTNALIIFPLKVVFSD